MSILRKPYEISLWEDEWNGEKFIEKRIMTIGSDTMEFQGRALEPKLVQKTNGEVNFSFKMYYTYIDTFTGEKVKNPFTPNIVNESKIKLKYGDEWFDLLVKSIAKDSVNKTYTYSLVDQHVTELSKNGYNVVLDTTLMNNMGTIEDLGKAVLEDTDWEVETEPLVQTIEEPLVMFKIPSDGIQAYLIDDSELTTNGAVATNEEVWIHGGAMVYVFYSCCSGGNPHRFQFICAPDGLLTDEQLGDKEPQYSNFLVGSDRIITDTLCQYYIDNIQYEPTDSSGIGGPEGWSLTFPEAGNNTAISINFRGKRYVYSEISEFHAGLNKYLTRYKVIVDGEPHEAYQHIKTNYIAPSILQNYVTSADFNVVDGWKGGKFGDETNADSDYIPTVEIFRNRYESNYTNTSGGKGVYIDSPSEAARGVDIAEKIYRNQLLCGNLGTQDAIEGKKKTIINSGPYDFKDKFSAFSVDEEYILTLTCAYISRTAGKDYYDWNNVDFLRPATDKSPELPFEFRVSNFQINGDINGYNESLIASPPTDQDLFWFSGKAIYDSGDFKITTTIKAHKALSKSDIIADNYQIFLNFDGLERDTENKKNYILIKKLEFYKKFPNDDGGFYSPNDPVNIDAETTYQEEIRYFDCVEDDTRSEDEISYLPGSITSAIPQLSDKAQKRTSISVKESNYYNAIQSLAEAFKCWARIYVPHDDNGNINGPKTIRFQNYVGQSNFAGFRYGINSKGITRTLDSKQVVSKLLVKANNNQFGQNGFCTISRAAANNLKDNTMYNFDYYVNQKLMDGTVLQSNLYIPNDNLTADNEDEYYTNPIGYYIKLGEINRQLARISNLLSQRSIPLTRAQSEVTTNETGRLVADEAIVAAKDSFYKIAGFDYNRLPRPNLLLESNKKKESTSIVVGSYKWASGTPLSKNKRPAADSPFYTGLNRKGHNYVCTIDCTPSASYSWISLVQGSWNNNDSQNTERMLSEWVKVEGGKRQSVIIPIESQDTDNETPIRNPSESDYQDAKSMWVAQRRDNADSSGPSEGGTPEGMIIHYIKVEEILDGTDTTPTAWVAATEEGGISGADKIKNSEELAGLLIDISTALSNKHDFQEKYNAAKTLLSTLQTEYDNLQEESEKWTDRKVKLNKAFISLYSRFIQEGTWIDESYMDDNLYYLGAQSVLYNSTMPKVSYNMQVISLSGLPGYEAYDFKIGDQTFIEDTEFFGYELDGVTPYQEQITVTEITNNLDDPSKDAFKVQNYENQFADLFQRITATVQSVQYSEGSYKKAADLAAADTAYKVSFLTDAINSADMEISNAAADSVSLGQEGLVIENSKTGKGIRLIDGGLYLKTRNEDGTSSWKTGITADGISANLITAGQIDTGIIQIMNGKQPTFRWDSHGLTAYSFNNSQSDLFLNNVDTTRGVRFDRFGLYGYSGIDGSTWHPQSISDEGDSVANIEDKSTFYLTWEGLKVKTKNGGTLRIGDNSKVTGEDDTSILTVTNKDGVIGLKIDENGNLNIGGSGGRVGQFILEDNKMNIYMSDISSMSNLYYGTQDFTGSRWENLSNWQVSGNTKNLLPYKVQQYDSLGNIKARRERPYGGMYQKFYAEKGHWYRCSARVSYLGGNSEFNWDATSKQITERLNASVRTAANPQSAFLDEWLELTFNSTEATSFPDQNETMQYNYVTYEYVEGKGNVEKSTEVRTATNIQRTKEYTVYLYFMATESDYVFFYVGRNNSHQANPPYFNNDLVLEVSSMCVTEYDIKETDAQHIDEFKRKQPADISWTADTSGHYNKGLRASGYTAEPLWQDNSSDKATIQFVVEDNTKTLNSKIEQTAREIRTTVSNLEEELYSELEQTAEGFVAKASDKSGGAGWNLTKEAFSVGVYDNKENYDEKIRVDGSGLTVKGHVEAESGKIGPLSVKNNWLLYPDINTSYQNIFDLQSLIGYTNIEIPDDYTLDYGISGDSKAYLTYNLNTGFIDKIVGITNNYTGSTDTLLCWPCNIGKIYAGKKYRISCEVPEAVKSLTFVMGFIPNSSVGFVQTNEATSKIIPCGSVTNSSTTKSVIIQPSFDFNILGLAIQANASSEIDSDVNITKIMVEEINSSAEFSDLEYSQFIGVDKQLLIGADCISLGQSSLNLSSTTRTVKGDNIFVGKSLNIGAGARMTVAEQKRVKYETSTAENSLADQEYGISYYYNQNGKLNFQLKDATTMLGLDYWFSATLKANTGVSEDRDFTMNLYGKVTCTYLDSWQNSQTKTFDCFLTQNIKVTMPAGRRSVTTYFGGRDQTMNFIVVSTQTDQEVPDGATFTFSITDFKNASRTEWEETFVANSQDTIYTIGNIANLTGTGKLINWCLSDGNSLEDTIATLKQRVKILGSKHSYDWD